MKKQNLIWVLPVILNVMAFTKRFLYNSIVMFLISFVVFFVYLYVDFSKRPNFRKSWNIIAGTSAYVSVIFYLFDTETMTLPLQCIAAAPVIAGIIMVIRTIMTAEKVQLKTSNLTD